MDAGYADSIYGELYHTLFAPKRGAALVDMEYPDTREVLDLIHSAGGVAVLAHPAAYHNEDLMEELIPLGLDGVEVWHPDHSAEDNEHLLEFARRHHLLATGGTDFHGMYSAVPRSLGSVQVEDSYISALLSYKDKTRRKNA